MCRRRRDLELSGKICGIHRRSRETYGAPNIHAELVDDHGIRVGRKRVARLIRQNGIPDATLHKCMVTTQSDPQAAKPIDLVEAAVFRRRAGSAVGGGYDIHPDLVRLAISGDGAGCVLGQDCRLGDGHEHAHRADPGRAADGRDVAPIPGVIHHSDRGSQYTSYAFGKRCREAGIMPSMGSVGDACQKAMAESFFATLEREVLNRRRFESQAEARMAVFEWIEGWYNSHRRHAGLGYRSPVNYERSHHQARARMARLLPPSAADSLTGKMSREA